MGVGGRGVHIGFGPVPIGVNVVITLVCMMLPEPMGELFPKLQEYITGIFKYISDLDLILMSQYFKILAVAKTSAVVFFFCCFYFVVVFVCFFFKNRFLVPTPPPPQDTSVYLLH